MSIQSPESFTILEELNSTEFSTANRAIHEPTSAAVRITRMAAEISASPEFRAAFRTDEASLSTLEHANVLKTLYWGEDRGSFFYVTEFPEGESLRLRLERGEKFSWDEFVDVGWQIASALQHCHNLGITHGQLSTSSVIIADGLRVKVSGFGLYRWIAATKIPVSGLSSFSTLAKQDLIDLRNVLCALQVGVRTDSVSATNETQLADMQSLIDTLQSPALDFTARDVQGRLGNMLLAVSGETIDMIDDRKGQGLSRRSLVDELFDEVDYSKATSGAHSDLRHPAISRYAIMVLLVVAGIVVVLALLR